MTVIEQAQAIARLVAKCRIDPDFKTALINDPVPLLHEEGVYVPDGLTITFVPSGQDVPPSTEQVAYLSVDVLDKDPDLLTEEALSMVSAGQASIGPLGVPAGSMPATAVCTCVASR